MNAVFLFIGIFIGAAAVWLVLKSKIESARGVPPEDLEELKNQVNSLALEKGKADERNKIWEEGQKQAASELSSERTKVLQLSAENSSLKAEYNNLQTKLNEQKGEIEELQEKFTKEFENLANKILDEKSTKFTAQNKENLDQILKPLSEKIKDFEKKVEEVYVTDTKERATLLQQIKTLHELNQQMSKDANNLTNALKGQTKTQGNWGEFILESILEKSGLVKGREYSVQESLNSSEGRKFQPDVLVKLPENKTIVIDSKVSLIAYEKYTSSDAEEDRQQALRDFILSIKNHIKGLSSKNYQNLYGIESLDFVLLFMPIEPAFGLAVQNDVSLFNDAFEKNIVIVSPSTLLATLRTIASIWRQENQNKNAFEIARQSGALYDKFVGFVDDLAAVGSRIDAAKDSYNSAFNKLKDGRGNLIRGVEKIKKLGAKTSKSIPQSLLDSSDEDEDATLLEQ